MTAKRIGAFLCVTVGLLSTAWGQDFRVETTIYELKESRVLVQSMTLFHAGRTYDFIHDLGELIVFEPARGQFTLLNTRQRREAVVHVDEINRMLQTARRVLDDHVTALKATNKPAAEPLIEQLLFQFNPQFEETFSQSSKGPELELKSKHFQYHVLCATPPSLDHGEAYLNYADWICRLNYVLQPNGILPDQRIRLDDALRRSHLIPIEVTFVGGIGEAIRIRALHRMYWGLNEKDRELIRQWDADLVSRDMKHLSLKDYQAAVLGSRKR